MSGNISRRYPPELKEQAFGFGMGAINKVAVDRDRQRETVRKCMHQAEIDGEGRIGITTEDFGRN